MVKIRYIFLLVVSFLLLFLFFYFKKSQKLISYSLEGKTYKLIIAKTPIEHQKGLMFYRSKKELKGADGMIFIFSNKNYRTFWNKNTFLDLDVYWIDGDRIVGKDFLPSIEKTKEILTISSPKPVNKVVEIVR
jgi:uncharacterized membrane protein (UPF0127 family)